MVLNIMIAEAESNQNIAPQPQSTYLDAEGTINDWLQREAALERLSRSFTSTKRPRSVSSSSTNTILTGPPSEAQSPSPILNEPEEELLSDPLDSEYSLSIGSDSQMTHQLPPAPMPSPFQQPVLKIPSDAQWITERLKTYRLYQNDREAYAKYPALKNKVTQILYRKRVSTVDPLDLQEFQEAWEEYKDKNEDTVLNKLLPFFMKEKRAVEIENPREQEDAHTVVSFLRSGLVEISNREFQRTCMPFQQDGSSQDKQLIDALAKESGMTNPKPDRTFGISMKKHLFPISGYPIPADIALWMEIMRGIHHAFFIIEGKSYQGSLLDAWNQVNRGGATLVSAARRVLATLGEPDVVGADMRTFVFSATLDPGSMQIWVHWAEVPAPGAIPKYHMTKLDSYAIDNEQTFGQLRKLLHNILDYGCGDRFKEQQALYDGIIVYKDKQQKQAELDAAKARAAAQKIKDDKKGGKAGNKRARSSVGASPSGGGGESSRSAPT